MKGLHQQAFSISPHRLDSRFKAEDIPLHHPENPG
jgi:hypothetical protein